MNFSNDSSKLNIPREWQTENIKSSENPTKPGENIGEVSSGNLAFLEPIVLEQFSVTLKPSRRKTTRRIQVSITGALVINNISPLKDKLKLVFENYDYVDFILSDIKQVDMTAIQLFYYLKMFYSANGKYISFDCMLSDEDNSLIMNAGLNGIFSNGTQI